MHEAVSLVSRLLRVAVAVQHTGPLGPLCSRGYLFAPVIGLALDQWPSSWPPLFSKGRLDRLALKGSQRWAVAKRLAYAPSLLGHRCRDSRVLDLPR